MKLLTCVCSVIAALACVVTATGQGKEKETVKRTAVTILLFDADTKDIAKGINQIDFPEEKVPKKVRLADAVAKPTPPGWDDFFKRALGGTEITDPKREWVMKSVKMTLADDTVVDAQLLSLMDTGKTTINLKRPLNEVNGLPTLTTDKGKRTWYVYMTPYEETLVIPKRGQEAEGKTEKRKALTILLLDADTKGISTGIKQIEIPEEKVTKKVRLADAVAKPPPEGWLDQFKRLLGGTEITDPKREWVVKSVKMTLADDKVVECQVLSLQDTGRTTIKLEQTSDGKSASLFDLNAFGKLTSDKGKRNWYIYMAEYWDTEFPNREKP